MFCFKVKNGYLIAFLLVCFSPMVYANAGVPMLYLAAPVFAMSLIPIIVIEVLYLSKSLSLPLGRSFKVVCLSNVVSTVVGMPLTWFLLVVVQMITGGGSAYGIASTFEKILAVTWQAPWLIPYNQSMNWMIPSAGLFLLIPFFFASWWSEFFVSKKMLPEQSSQLLKEKIRNANGITYGLLALWPLGFFVLHYVTS